MSIQKAFTLIELLIAIAIVAILSGFIFIQTNNVINASKDTQRKLDIELLANAVISFSTENFSRKPVTDVDGCTIGGDCGAIEVDLKTYLPNLPIDPNSGSYYVYQSDGNNCKISAKLSDGSTYQYSCETKASTVGSPTSGVCGSANGSNSYNQPTTDFCSDGSIPEISGTGPWTWKCPGTYLGSDADCLAYKSIDGICNSETNNNNYLAAPTNLCSVGEPSSVSAGTVPANYWSWTCSGTNGGIASNCTANLTVNGFCGTASGLNYYTLTATSPNLCGENTVLNGGSVNGSGPWTWGCNGIYGGTNTAVAACSASKIINGTCGSANGQYYASAPGSSVRCGQGTPSDTSSWSWICNGINGGSSSGTCTAYQKQSCSALGGTMTTCGSVSCCRIAGSSCPSGWSYTGYNSTSTVSYCGNGVCGTPGSQMDSGGYVWYHPYGTSWCLNSSSHTWSNVSNSNEWVYTYNDCLGTGYGGYYNLYIHSTYTEVGCQ